MNCIYRISVRSRIVLYLLAVSLVATGVSLLVSWYAHGGAPYLLVISAACAAFAVLLVVSIRKERYEVYDDRCVSKTIFSSRVVYFSDAIGYRIAIRDCVILLKEGAGRFTIYSNTARFNELVAYIHQRIPNLDEVEANSERQRLFIYSTEGYTAQEQAIRLKKVKLIAKVLNAVSLTVSLPLVFIPIYNVWILGLCMLLPLLGYILYAGSGGLVNPFSENYKSPLASLKSTLMLPPSALAMRCMKDYTILSFASYWGCASIFCLVVLGIAFYRQANNSGGRTSKDRMTSALLLLFVLVYVSSATIISNIVLNSRNTKKIEARITNRWKVETSKSSEYYVQVEKRGELQLSEPIKVSGRVYKRLGKRLVVYYNKGVFDIPVIWVEM